MEGTLSDSCLKGGTLDFFRFLIFIQHSFSHIFGGGYAAGYYSYKWAEVLSSDAFSLFEDQGVFNQDLGAKFITEVLEQGGTYDAKELFVNFCGREPDISALLRHSGIENQCN